MNCHCLIARTEDGTACSSLHKLAIGTRGIVDSHVAVR
jgi:hypothetical protein